MEARVHYNADGSVGWSLVDNGDGTGTRTVYTPEGDVESVEQLTGLPIPEPPEPDPIEALQAQVQAQQETIDALLAALGGDSE